MTSVSSVLSSAYLHHAASFCESETETWDVHSLIGGGEVSAGTDRPVADNVGQIIRVLLPVLQHWSTNEEHSGIHGDNLLW